MLNNNLPLVCPSRVDPLSIPTLSPWLLGAMALALAWLAATVLRRGGI